MAYKVVFWLNAKLGEIFENVALCSISRLGQPSLANEIECILRTDLQAMDAR